jgi:hypothetical protein
MHRRKVTLTAAAIFAFGVAFAAQPTSVQQSGPRNEDAQHRSPWVPGRNMLMSAHEPSVEPLSPPR